MTDLTDLLPEDTTPCPACDGVGCALCHSTGDHDAWEEHVARL